jgi:hypothetical protein
MGVLYDLILAADDEVESMVDFMSIPPENMICTKILDPVTVAQLYVILLGGDIDRAIDQYVTPVLSAHDDELTIYRLPDEFVARLMLLSADNLKHVAQAWFKTDEIQLHRKYFDTNETWLRELLDDMQKLALRALHSKKHLFLRCTV